jgi:hypothetical protein
MLSQEEKLLLPTENRKFAPGLIDRIWLSRQMARLDKLIREAGWAFIPVQLPHDRAPRWFYTAGFVEKFGQPEMIIFDAPADVAWEDFAKAFHWLLGGGQPLEDGMTWAEDEGKRSVLREARFDRPQGIRYLPLAEERHLRLTGKLEGFRALQIVLPDREGRLPWDAGHDEKARFSQPQLYDPSSSDESDQA